MTFKARGWYSLMVVGTCAVVLGSMLAGSGFTPRVVAEEPKKDPAVERTREQVKMLDALYKNAVVSITNRYKKGQPAIMVAKDVFKAMEDAKYHSARLVDATGDPLGEETSPKSEFEKRAAKAMQEGKPYIDEIVGQGKDRRLLVATVVPAVLQRCADCHSVEKGDLLGFIRYELPIK